MINCHLARLDTHADLLKEWGFTAIERKTGHRITASALGELADLLETGSKADSH
jgi:hypothetical protein